MVMEVRLLTRTPDNFVVGVCILDPDAEGVGNRTFSLIMHIADWIVWLWNLLHTPMALFNIVIRNEELLHGPASTQ